MKVFSNLTELLSRLHTKRNYEIKRQKLEDNLSTLENIASLIRETERVLDERKDILEVMTPDERITRVAIDVRIRFKDVFHSLIELEHTIRDYLHQIDTHSPTDEYICSRKMIRPTQSSGLFSQYAKPLCHETYVTPD